MTEEQLLKALESGELTEEQLDAIIAGGGTLGTPTETTPVVAGAQPPTQLQESNLRGGEPQPSLKDILQQGAVGAGGRLLSYWKGLPGVASETERAEHGRNVSRMREELPYSGLGEGVADVAVSALAPLSRAPSMVSRAARTGAMMAPTAAVAARGQGGTTGDMARDAAWGFGGGALGSAVTDLGVKGINAMRGKWDDPSKKYIRDFARDELGLELRTGDLYPNSIARGLENLGTRHPILSKQGERLEAQVDAMSQSLFSGGENKLVDAIQRSKTQLDEANKRLWEPVSKAAQGAGKVPTITLRDTLLDLQKTFPDLLSQIKNQEVQGLLSKVIGNGKRNSFPPSLDFDEVRKLQQSLGPITAQIKRQAATGTAEAGEVQWINKLYGSTHKDLQRWGADPKNASAYNIYSKVNDEYKKSLLPFYRNPIVSRVETGDYYHAPESMLKDLMSPSNRSAREELLYYLSQTDHKGTGILETLKAADRASRAMIRPDAEPTGSLGMGALMAPKVFAAQLGGATMAESNKLLPWYAASPYIGPSRMQSGVKGGLGLMGSRNTEIRGE